MSETLPRLLPGSDVGGGGACSESGHVMRSSVLNVTFDCARTRAMFPAAATGGSAHEQDWVPGYVGYVVVPASAGLSRLCFTRSAGRS